MRVYNGEPIGHNSYELLVNFIIIIVSISTQFYQ